jgi:putative transposase
MGIARSTFYDRPGAGADDATVVAQMKSICDEFETYGYRRVDAELRHRGLVVNGKKVRRLMREHALNPQPRRRFIATTDSDHNDPICPNLATTMTLDGPNQLWVADITYVATSEGWLYLACVMDLASRRIVGWSMSERITADLVCQALKSAYWRRKPSAGLIMHSDRGSQYASHSHRQLIKDYRMVQSMSRRASCWDTQSTMSLNACRI